MKPAALFRACLLPLAASSLLVSAALATTGPGVGVRLHSYTPPASPGEPARFEVRLEAREAITLAGFDPSGPAGRGARVTSSVPAGPVVIPRGQNRVYSFTAEGEAAEGEVTLRFTANGRPVVKRFDFSRANRERRLRPASLRTVPGAVPGPAGDPGLLRAEPAPSGVRPAHSKPVRAAVAPRSAAPLGPSATQGRIVRVRGSLTFVRDDGVRVGADGVTFRVYDEDFDWDELVHQGTLGTNGSFDETLYFDESEPDIYIEFETMNSKITVEDGSFTEDNYFLETARFEDHASGDADFGVLEPSDGGLRPVLHIFTNLLRSWRWWAQNRSNNVNHLECQYPDGDWPNYDGEIHIPWGVGSKATRWDSDTHVHEYGHHLRNQFMTVAASNYDNGVCNNPNGDPGHCAWCEETGATAVNEGWPNWYADHILSEYPSKYGIAANRTRDTEWIQECLDQNDDPCSCDEYKTEGFFQVLFKDIVDNTPGENDPRSGRAHYFDKVNSTIDAALDALILVTNTADFINTFRSFHPEIPASDWWHTLNNAGFDIPDTGPPTLPGQFWSPSHDPNVRSPKRSIVVNWGPGADAESGLRGYHLCLSEQLRQPASGDHFVDANAASWTAPLQNVEAGHSYYVAIRAVDNEGNLSTDWRWDGPFPIREFEPPDLAAGIPGSSWYRPLVARDDSAGTPVWPTASLPGNSAGTWLNVHGSNHGELTAHGTETKLFLDGTLLESFAPSIIAVGEQKAFLNRGPFTVRGGRHAVQVLWDGGEKYSESDEVDNLYTTQYTWLPLNMSNIITYTRTAPPWRDAGRLYMDPTQDFYWNCDGLRFQHRPSPTSPMTSWWSAVALHQVDWFDDYDLALHDASDLSGVGFDIARGRSNRDHGLLDAVFSNRRAHSTDKWDVGVVNADSGLGSYKARHVTSGAVALGDSVLVSQGVNVMLTLRELTVGAGEGGTIEVVARVVRGSRYLYGLRFDKTFQKGGIDDFAQKVAADGVGAIRMVFTAAAGDVVPLAFYRNASTSTPDSTIQFTLQVRRLLPDLVASAPANWHSPLVPRATAGIYTFGLAAPAALEGDDAPTYLNYSYENASPSPINQIVFMRVRHDLTTLVTPSHASMTANERRITTNQGPHTLPGGRHVLSLGLDWYSGLLEESEANNLWAEQWVWTPDTLSYEESAWRHGTNGSRNSLWTSISSGEVLYPNADGVRTPWPPAPTRWFGAAVMPKAGNDVDLFVHDAATGAKDGFEESLASSQWGPGALDYVLWDHQYAIRRAFDLGLARVSADTGSFVVQPTRAVTWATLGGSHSGRMDAGDILELHEFDLPAGNHRFDLSPLSPPVDFGMALHAPGSAFSNRSAGDALAAAYLAPEGAAESFVVTVQAPGRYALAVWKNAQADIGDVGRYFVNVTSTVLDAGLPVPAATRLAWASPNPSRHRTVIRFELARESDVILELHDVRGARVRTLAEGVRGAGAHEVAWDGRDAAGRSLPAGVYLARMRAGETASTLKVVRIE